MTGNEFTATPRGDGSWRIKGTKIFITFGDHDLADNIVHLVLARTPDAPAGTQGHLAVPRAQDPARRRRHAGRLQRRPLRLDRAQAGHPRLADLRPGFGDHDDCHRLADRRARMGGMRAMFTMMNNARLNVGLQGVADRRARDAARRSPMRASASRARATARAGRDRRASRRAPHAAADEGADPGGARARLLRRGQPDRAQPRRRRGAGARSTC